MTTASLVNAKPCPYCGGSDLILVPWSDEHGDYDAIECNYCLGAAPANQWNTRTTDQTTARGKTKNIQQTTEQPLDYIKKHN